MKIASILTLLAVSILAASTAKAQHNFEQWNGGNGTWDAGVGPTAAADWNNNQTYVNSIARDSSATPAVSVDYFGSTPGTITVNDSLSSTPVTSGVMEFNSGNMAGTWTIQGAALSSIAADFTATVIQIDNGQKANVTVTNTLNVAPNPTNGGSYFINDGSGTTLKVGNINISSTPITFNDYSGPGNTPNTTTAGAPYNYTRRNGDGSAGNPYTYSTNTVNSQNPVLFAANGNTIEIDGNITTDSGLYAGMLVGNYGDTSMETGTYIFKGGLDYARNGNKEFDFGSGNIILETSDTGTGDMCFVGAGQNLPQTILTSGAQTIVNHMYDQGASNAIVGGSTKDISTFSGEMSAGGGDGELTLRAAAGGRVYFSGNIDGDNGATSSGDSTVGSTDGNGTVVLSRATGNTFTSYGAHSFEVQSGTVLITNTSGSAFGNGPQNGNAPQNPDVQVDAGAILGGSGISTQKVTVVAGGIIAPGDAGQSNLGIAPSIATLHLTGGLSSTGGAVLAFKVDGLANDAIDLGAGALSLNGTVNVDVSSLGSVKTWTQATGAQYYTFMTGTGNWTSSNPTFDISAPTGYLVEHTIFDTVGGQQTFEVEFRAVPEPSTWAMMLGGLAFLGFCIRRRNHTV